MKKHLPPIHATIISSPWLHFHLRFVSLNIVSFPFRFSQSIYSSNWSTAISCLRIFQVSLCGFTYIQYLNLWWPSHPAPACITDLCVKGVENLRITSYPILNLSFSCFFLATRVLHKLWHTQTHSDGCVLLCRQKKKESHFCWGVFPNVFLPNRCWHLRPERR